MDPLEFGRHIKSLREAKGLTLTELSKLSGASHPYLSQIENGRKGIPSTKVLKKLAGPLDVPYMELMYFAGHVEHQPAAVDFGMEDLERITFYFPQLEKEDLARLESKHKKYFDEDFKITPKYIGDLLWEEPINPRTSYLIDDLNSLIYKKMAKKTPSTVLDLKELLKNEISYDGVLLSSEDRKRIQDMLVVLFQR
jgi:transcriptional regulator with XRE-family HTH domain